MKLAPEVGGVPKREGLGGGSSQLVTLLRVLVTLLTPRKLSRASGRVMEVLAVVTEVTVEVAVAWPVKEGTRGSGQSSCLLEGS